jgi:single-stranded-DNA-specific exonuclease
MTKKWRVAQPITDEFKNRFPQINNLVLQLLFNRGIDTQEKIDEFLNPDYIADLHDPFLFNDMKKTVRRIFLAIEKNEKIVVHGDYDADGVTGSVVLIKALQFLGAQNIDVYIPHRELEGYGLNTDTINELAKNNCNLIITTDCGISNIEEVKLANKLGIDVIITDHHHAPEKIPPALAIINPKVSGDKYPFEHLAGVGIAFKLVQALLSKSKINDQKKEGFEKWLLDLVAIGTIADCSPLVGENRTLVKYGLIVLNKTSRLGLRKLIEDAGYELDGKTKLSTFNIGYQISPRINAAGRMDHATVAFEMLMADEPGEAEKLVINLADTNRQRQKETEDIYKDARKQALTQKDDYLIVVCGKNWSIGLVGLVGGKLTNEFNRPTLVLSENENEISGSARSIPQFNVIEALSAIHEMFARFGGHSQAAGFTLKSKDQLEEFKKKIKKLAKEQLQHLDLSPVLNIDAEIKLNDINWELFENLEELEPFGEQNTEPLFLIKQAEIVEVRGVGQDEKHLRLRIKQDNKFFNVIGFCFGNTDDGTENWCEKLNAGNLVDIVAQVSVNEWNGNRELQLKLVDIKIGNMAL